MSVADLKIKNLVKQLNLQLCIYLLHMTDQTSFFVFWKETVFHVKVIYIIISKPHL